MTRKNMLFAVLMPVLLAAGGFLLQGCQSKALIHEKKANKHFNKGEYWLAIEDYEQALKAGGDSARIMPKLGTSLHRSNNSATSKAYYRKAIQKAKNQGKKPADSLYYYYGIALKANGQYKDAEAQLQKYLDRNPDEIELANRARLEVENMDKIKGILNKETEYQVRNFEEVNTEASDFSPLFYEDELLFSSGRGEGKLYHGDGGGYFDIYKYKFDGVSESSGAVKALSSNINQVGRHEASATLTPDGKTMVFARSNNEKRKKRKRRPYTDLYMSTYKNGEWQEPRLLRSISDSTAWDANPAFSQDGSRIYWSSSRPGGKGLDIWYAEIDEYGRFGTPKNLNEKFEGINTAGQEMFPYVAEDGRLFFASDGHPSIGNLDIFEVTLKNGKPNIKNMGKPINSTADDFSITLRTETEGYFASSRPGGKGRDDIYFFKEKVEKEKIAEYVLKGKLLREETEDPLGEAKVKLYNDDGSLISEATTSSDGRFSFPVKVSHNYTLFADKEGFFKKRKPYTTHGKAVPLEDLEPGKNTITLRDTFKLQELVEEKNYELSQIYYDYDKASIREDASNDLEKLLEILKDNPNIKIELSAHTDVRGSHEYNMKLSQERAESVVDWLTERGIEKDRLVPKGYGETRPKIPNAQTEEDHQANRRTEFKVLETTEEDG